ncbi:hypothetical protein [Flavobacterium sp.]|uniref:hypothetical protein n=1 Tax=Flavobacterium sp. TaxID=239 RepID=UPI003D0E253D
MKLLEKFKPLVNGYVGSSMLTNTEYPETIQSNAEKCVNICNENTVDFLNWLENSGYRYNEDVKMFKHKDGRLQTNESLVEIFSTK